MNERAPMQIKLMLFNSMFVTNCLLLQGLRVARQTHACDSSRAKVVFGKRFKLRVAGKKCLFYKSKEGAINGRNFLMPVSISA